MDWKDIAGEWKLFTAPIRQQWSKLGDAELEAAEGSRERLIGAIRKAYGISQEQAEKQVAAWVKRAEWPPTRSGS